MAIPELLGIALQAFQVEDQHLVEQKAVLPAQCNHLTALHTLRLDCFSEMKSFPQQVSLQPTNQRLLVLAWALYRPTERSEGAENICLSIEWLYELDAP